MVWSDPTICHTDPTKTREWTHVLANGKQFLSEDKHDKFNVYIDEELNFDNKINSHSMVICLSCYTPFILYSKSDKYEQKYALSERIFDWMFRTFWNNCSKNSWYQQCWYILFSTCLWKDCWNYIFLLHSFLYSSLYNRTTMIMSMCRFNCSTWQNEALHQQIFCFRLVFGIIFKNFSSYSSLFLQSVYSDYCDHVVKSIYRFKCMMHYIKCFFGCLNQAWVPQIKFECLGWRNQARWFLEQVPILCVLRIYKSQMYNLINIKKKYWRITRIEQRYANKYW